MVCVGRIILKSMYASKNNSFKFKVTGNMIPTKLKQPYISSIYSDLIDTPSFLQSTKYSGNYGFQFSSLHVTTIQTKVKTVCPNENVHDRDCKNPPCPCGYTSINIFCSKRDNFIL